MLPVFPMTKSPIAESLTRPIPGGFAAALYLVFSVADLLFSLVAFSYGVAEGNPAMAWLLERGVFIQGKIALTLLVAGLMMVIYAASRRYRWTVWSGVGVMAAVVAYHLWAIPRLTGGSLPGLLAVS